MQTNKVVVRSTKRRAVPRVMEDIMRCLDWEKIIPRQAQVLIKPNLSSNNPKIAFATNTSSEVLSALIDIIKTRTDRIIIGESDGTRFSAEECFEVSGYSEVLRKHQVAWVNFSHSPTRPAGHPLLKNFELPVALEEADVFITMPKLKTHALTMFTGALKNQWGCIPRYDRIALHPYLDELIAQLNLICRSQIVLMDAIWGMEGRGPVNGHPIELDLILGSLNPVALDATAMRLVGLNPYDSKHLILSAKYGVGKIEEIEVDSDVKEIKRIQPAHLDWTLWLMNYLTRSSFFTYHILLNNSIFNLGKKMVSILRKFKLA